MKKKLLVLGLTLSIFLTICGLTACGHKHEYTQTLIEPTCQQGYTLNECECGDTFKSDYVDAIGHSFTNYVSNGDNTETAQCDYSPCKVKDTRPESKLIFKTLPVVMTENNTIYMYLKIPNATQSFTFSEEIIKNGSAEYLASYDIEKENVITDDTIALNEKDNLFYVFEKINGIITKTYNITLYRRPMLTATFKSYDETVVDEQTVEEGSFITAPTDTITRVGYDFNNWQFNFEEGLFESKDIYASWIPIFDFSNGQITGLNYYSWGKEEIEIPNKIDGVDVVSIGAVAFLERTALKSIKIADSVKDISSSAFYGCTNLSSIEFGTGLKNIDLQAFYNCTSLENIELPIGVESIGNRAFFGCQNLKKVILPTTLKSIGVEVFGNCNSLEFNVSKSINYIGAKNNDHFYLHSPVSTEISEIDVEKGCVHIGSYAFSGIRSFTELLLAENTNLRTIGSSAFKQCGYLEKVELPEGLQVIEDYAFYSSNMIKNINLPNSLISIGSTIFGSATSLTFNESNGLLYLGSEQNPYLYLYNYKSTSSVETVTIETTCRFIGKDALRCCPVIEKEVTISNNVVSIDDNAFEYCTALEKITIGANVVRIGRGCFKGCLNLGTIIFYGTVEQWSNIELGSGWESMCLATYVQCSDGQVAIG